MTHNVSASSRAMYCVATPEIAPVLILVKNAPSSTASVSPVSRSVSITEPSIVCLPRWGLPGTKLTIFTPVAFNSSQIAGMTK